MKIALDVRISLEENAAHYFDLAKKSRNKIAGAKEAIRRAEQERDQAQTKADTTKQKDNAPRKIRKKSWYEKFKWFYASNGMLVIGGRDATTNEIIIKKHVNDKEGDIIFHTDAPGSPFTVIKAEGKTIPDEIKQEAADFCASHSKSWKLGLGSADVYWINPEQVTKEAKSGEYLTKGAFMVYGKRNDIRPVLGLMAMNYEDKVMIGPISAIKKQLDKDVLAVEIQQGSDKTSDAAKKIQKILGNKETDDIIPNLPSGTFLVKRFKKME